MRLPRWLIVPLLALLGFGLAWLVWPVDGPSPAEPPAVTQAVRAGAPTASGVLRATPRSPSGAVRRIDAEPVPEASSLEVPLLWPVDVPAALRPDVFPSEATAILRDCSPEVRVRRVECAEPPCLVVASDERRAWWPMPWQACPAWEERYGDGGLTLHSSPVDCGDLDEQVLVLAPAQAWLEDHGIGVEVLAARFDRRVQAVVEAWGCGGG